MLLIRKEPYSNSTSMLACVSTAWLLAHFTWKILKFSIFFKIYIILMIIGEDSISMSFSCLARLKHFWIITIESPIIIRILIPLETLIFNPCQTGRVFLDCLWHCRVPMQTLIQYFLSGLLAPLPLHPPCKLQYLLIILSMKFIFHSLDPY